MTEEEWLECNDPEPMLDCVEAPKGRASGRKLRLFGLACFNRLATQTIPPACLAAIAAVELFVEGLCGSAELAGLLAILRAKADALRPHCYASDGHCLAGAERELLSYAQIGTASCVVNPCIARTLTAIGQGAPVEAVPIISAAMNAREARAWETFIETGRREDLTLADRQEGEMQARLLRDIFGNPFRPVTFSPGWRTDTAVALARQMYDSRDFSAMPILADALQDAGCDNDDILSHCRGDGPHVRGCWVVDLVLGKQRRRS